MIIQFTFENFKAFKNEALIDFTAEPITEHENSLLYIHHHTKDKLLPVIAIYGPNGGGKSTVLEALAFLRNTILRVILLTKSHDNENFEPFLYESPSALPQETYYKFSEKHQKLPTKYDIMFFAKGYTFRYQLSMLKKQILEESLYVQIPDTEIVRLLFERSEHECILGEELENIAVEKVNDTMPLLSHIAINYDIETIDIVIDWFESIAVLDYNNPRSENRIFLPKIPSARKQLFQMLEEVDIPIKNIRFEKDSDGNIKNVYTTHMTENGGYLELRIQDESSGTRKLLTCLAKINICLENGYLLIADELDAKLHPKLLQYIIELFTKTKSNKKGAQLLLTSHDITTLNHDIFRRDEIWFCAKNPYGASKLYSLASFRKKDGSMIRKDESYGKRYFEGRYGADPYIQRIINWEENHESETKKI